MESQLPVSIIRHLGQQKSAGYHDQHPRICPNYCMDGNNIHKNWNFIFSTTVAALDRYENVMLAGVVRSIATSGASIRWGIFLPCYRPSLMLYFLQSLPFEPCCSKGVTPAVFHVSDTAAVSTQILPFSLHPRPSNC